tara:strand:- start:2491 stop:2691 length:201 start_codon:yes stop_codon:yes gene_type:complete
MTSETQGFVDIRLEGYEAVCILDALMIIDRHMYLSGLAPSLGEKEMRDTVERIVLKMGAVFEAQDL